MARGDWQRRVQGWMSGRRGPDDLATFCVDVALVVVVANVFAQSWALSAIALALIAYAWFRIRSKSLGARARENESFLKALGPLRPWVQNPGAAWSEWRAYKHIRCPHCGQRVRVPRKKGKLRVTCPKCHEKFEARS